MIQLTIIPQGDSAAVVLPADLLASAGLQVGDVVEVTVVNRQLVLRPADGATCEDIDDITRDVFQQRKDAYRRLA